MLLSCRDIKAPEKQAAQNCAVAKETFDTSKGNDSKWISFQPQFGFDSFPARVYTGKLAEPNFSTVSFGKENEFQDYLMTQMKGMGINFAGKYTLVTRSCGAMCQGIYIIDRKTGRIYADLPVNNGGRWGYRFIPTSSLLIANAEMLNDSLTVYSETWGEKPELYNWNGTQLVLLQ